MILIGMDVGNGKIEKRGEWNIIELIIDRNKGL